MEFVFVFILGSVIAAPWICRATGRYGHWIIAAAPAALFVYFLTHMPDVAGGDPVVVRRDWVPSLKLSITLYLDSLSLIFALLITGIGSLVVVYAGGYLKGHRDLGRFYSFLLFFMGSMLGVVLADNVLALFLFWELTSISSYLLIAFDHESQDARSAANQALLVTSGGGLVMLAGLLLLGQVGGTYELSALREAGDTVRDDGLYLAILLLILGGAFTKSAQFPFHFWLPGAMVAPTPVSAYLHSATMVKAGVYLLERLSPTLGGTDEWHVIVTTVGAVTMVVGGLVAFFQTDLKRLLAYSTISALGTLMLLVGLGTGEAASGAVVFLGAHALYKCALFMIAGAVDHETGTRDILRLGGLWRSMPITAGVAVLAAVSLAGFGPVFSFIGKELLFEAVLHADKGSTLLVIAVVAGGALFVAVAGLTCVRPFLGLPKGQPTHAHEAPPSMLLGPVLLTVLSVLFGLVPTLIAPDLLTPAAEAILGASGNPAGISLWHGFGTAFFLSALSLAIGIVAYLAWLPLYQIAAPRARLASFGPGGWYSAAVRGLIWVATWHTRIMQNGYLRAYLAVTIVTAFAVAWYTLLSKAELEGFGEDWGAVRLYHVGLAAVMLSAAIVSALTSSRLAAVAALGVVGYGVALTYILFGAPDLAMTQVMVETLTVVLFLSVLYHLPGPLSVASKLNRARDAAIAVSAGAFVTVLILLATSHRAESPVAEYYANQSVPLAHGRNIVNVILVDFRALDTLGEITVLAAAAFGVYALLRLRPDRSREEGGDA